MSVEVGMDSSVSPCSIFFSMKVSKNASNRISKAFADIILSEKQSNNHIGTFLYLIKSRWFFFYLYFSYFLLLVSWPPFQHCTW